MGKRKIKVEPIEPAQEDTQEVEKKEEGEHGIPFAEAMKIIKENPGCGLKFVKENRHFALPYHLIGDRIKPSIEFICNLQINNVGGVVVSVDFDKIRIVSKLRVIDDQTCFHCNTVVPLVIFSPKDQLFEATVTSINASFATALIYKVITVNIDRDKLNKRTFEKLDVGDRISVECASLQIKRGMCQMKGTLKKLIRKETNEELQLRIKLEATSDELTAPVTKVKKSIRLDEDDE